MSTLFAVEAPPTGVELVRVEDLVCVCGPTWDVTHAQPALFVGNGHGAVEVVRVRGCDCGRIRLEERWPDNPRRYR